ncbi:aminotransferase class V-fold PLP-dependent enzyme [Paludisphaera mucosa]|uniref:Aminotransferase class V-fold PLP-dependent enzyme n=1 Tax=Paludisphaera mucosa TaxID=3030827 RepID=A0ABT6FGF0_9BACT|nr:aminotransferase class V-fold PLP-dependent enzyme [Paludisphaera mucosa]MDG3006493.1 aminotransferase class V-fold PLP-dependent enzyme [Paludisphaera mucosa]
MGMNWAAIREAEFPVAREWAYFDHAAVAPIPRRSAEALRLWAEGQAAHGATRWGEWGARIEALRTDLADWIAAHPDEIAFVANTTHGIGLVAEGFPWKAGDNVVVPAEEYPSNVYPWMNLADRGVETRLVPSRDDRIRIEDLRDAMDDRTRVLAVSHVEFASGFRNDLDAIGELCRSRGVAFFVDAIQGLGPLELDVRRTPVDFAAADGHKWLLGPEGAGFLYVRREWIDRLRPLGVGWHSVTGAFSAPGLDFTLKPNAQRWEGGSCNMPGLQGFAASLTLLREIGPRDLSLRLLDRAEAVREAVAEAGWRVLGSTRPEDRSAIVVAAADGVDPEAAATLLRSHRVIASCRRGRLRISPHVYTDDDDLRRLRDGLAAARGVAPPSGRGS